MTSVMTEWFVEQRSEVNDRVQVYKRRLTEPEARALANQLNVTHTADGELVYTAMRWLRRTRLRHGLVCSVDGCRHAGQQYVVHETAFGGIAFTKRLVVLCPQHGFARALVDGMHDVR